MYVLHKPSRRPILFAITKAESHKNKPTWTNIDRGNIDFTNFRSQLPKTRVCRVPFFWIVWIFFFFTKTKFTSKKLVLNEYENLSQNAGNVHFRDSNSQTPPPPFQKARGFGAHCAPLLKVLDPSLLRTLRLDRRREYPAI